MNLKRPLFWNLKKPNFFAYILIPFTLPIIINNFFRKIKRKKKFLNIKSICVGNIYLGGTGKTPLTIKLYQIIKDMGLNVVTAKKFHSKQIDEQILLKEKTKTILTKNRIEAVNRAIKDSFDILIFDDGLQENKIEYDLKIVCFNNKNWIGNGLLIPSGPLREKIKSLKNYDIVFLNGKSENILKNKEVILKMNSKIKIFESNYEIKNLDKLNRKSKYLIFSGIGEPSSFRDILQKNNINIVKEIIYPDHHDYKKKDLENIFNEAKKNDAKILTTEKDFVKLSNDHKKQINYLEIETNINNEQIFINLLNDKLSK
ncbi:tetraacyldisaccharide 4'-kinase [Pelagibacterales bacterium SAG-MED07]|nr:tetraacyldisaccharide 4'-kinase [Pelagibacterales bacterium SAG-MED07]